MSYKITAAVHRAYYWLDRSDEALNIYLQEEHERMAAENADLQARVAEEDAEFAKLLREVEDLDAGSAELRERAPTRRRALRKPRQPGVDSAAD